MLVLFFAACTDTPKPGDSGPIGHDSADDSLPGDSGDPLDTASVDGVVSGTVTVQLYSTDEAGEVTEVSWADYGGPFPFGGIFVGAYTIDEETNATSFHANDAILHPSTAGDPYSLDVRLDDAEEVWIYAALDYANDGVIGSAEPIGTYPDLVAVIQGGTVEGVDIVIQAEIPASGGGDGGDDSGAAGDTITLSGDVEIDADYNVGDARVMVYDTSGEGPYYSTLTTPSATETGASGVWSMEVAPGFGDCRLIGAWDANDNGLIEPTDRWGAYAVAGENANPLTIGSVDIPDLGVLVPLGIPPSTVPFVRLDGALSYEDGFDTLPAGSVIYVAALRTRPNADFSFEDLEHAYDWSSYDGAVLTGTALDYTLIAPSDGVVYIWAYGDLDGDGLLNEVGEPVGSFGPTGRYQTADDNVTGLDMMLQMVSN